MERTEDKSRFRVLVAGPFSQTPASARLTVSSGKFADALRGAASSITAKIPDRMVGAGFREVTLRCDSVRTFQLESVAASVLEIAPIARMLGALSDPVAANRDTQEVAKLLLAELGPGELAQRAVEALGNAPAPAPASNDGQSSNSRDGPPGDVVDAIFSGADVRKATAAAAIDAFIGAMRGPIRGAGGGLRKARAVLEDALFAAAADILRLPQVQNLEAAWRALKFLADTAGGDGEVLVEVLDVNAHDALPAVERCVEVDPLFGRPDVIVLAEPVARIEELTPWAELGESLLAPVIATISQGHFGEALQAMEEGREVGDGLLPGWTELRGRESSRWLAVATNPAVLYSEGNAALRRTTFGPAGVVLAAFLVSSYRRTGTVAQIIGPNNGLKAPASWTLPSGREAGKTAPLERFLSIQAQTALADQGLIALGAVRNSEKLVLARAPAARRSHDAVSLPAQILTGRIVRFAQWFRDQLEPGTAPDQIPALFKDAADVLLFPLSRGTAVLTAQVVEQAGQRELVAEATVQAAYGGSPFQLAFSLGALR